MLRSNCKKLLLIGICFTPLAWAQSVSLDAHVHGEAELMIAVEGKNIEIQLVSPAANILGFEQAPTTTAQKEQILRVETILTNTESLFEFKGATCQSISQTVEVPFTEEVAKEHEEHEEHEEHSQHNEPHSEVLANYVFSCNAGTVTEIQALFLTQFPDIELLEVQWITETKQGAQELGANQPWIDLR